MNSAEPANAQTSGRTSSNAPAATDKLTEAQFLQHQAELARQALSQTWERMKSDLARGVSPAEWMKQYPWVSLGAATVAGFVAATQLVPSKEEQALKKLAALERALHPAPPHTDGGTTDKEPAKHGILYGFFNEALKAVQPVLISAITAKVAAQEVTEEDKNQDGKQSPGSAGWEPGFEGKSRS